MKVIISKEILALLLCHIMKFISGHVTRRSFEALHYSTCTLPPKQVKTFWWSHHLYSNNCTSWL